MTQQPPENDNMAPGGAIVVTQEPTLAQLRNWHACEEVASILGVSARTVLRYIQTGKLEGRTVDGRMKVSPESLLAFREGGDGGDTPQNRALADMASMVGKGFAIQTTHTQKIMELHINSQAGLLAQYEKENGRLTLRIEKLETELDSYRERERTWLNDERQFRLEEKRLEGEIKNRTELLNFGKSFAPQIFALVTSHLRPTDPGPTEAGIASWLQSISPEKAMEIAPILSGAQQAKLLEIKQSGRWNPGELAAWVRSLEAGQIQQILPKLNAEQVRGLMAYHEAAIRLKTPAGGALGSALGAMGAGAALGAMGAMGAGPAPTAPTAPASTASAPAGTNASAPAEEGVWLTKGQAQSYHVIFKALFDCPESVQRAVFDKVTQADFDAFLQAFKEAQR